MKKKTLFGAGLFTILAVFGAAACHHRSPEARVGWLVEEAADRLSLDSYQTEWLETQAAAFLDRKRQMHEDREKVRETVMAELRKEHIDRTVIDTLVTDKRRKMDDMMDELVDTAIAFHEMLTPEQREKLVAELDKLHARAEKYGHHRW